MKVGKRRQEEEEDKERSGGDDVQSIRANVRMPFRNPSTVPHVNHTTAFDEATNLQTIIIPVLIWRPMPRT